MKSLVKTALAILLISLPLKAYAGWGMGLNVGYWKMEVPELANSAGKLTQGSLSPDISVFYEFPGSDGLKYDLSFGLGLAAGIEYDYSWTVSPGLTETGTLETTATDIPILFSIKSPIKGSKYSLFGGAGLDLMMTKTTVDYQRSGSSTESGSDEESKTQVMPSLAAGAEYFTTDNFSVGLNLKYLFLLETEANGAIPYDGLRVNLALRYYFGDSPR